jgi:hypothetical protein
VTGGDSLLGGEGGGSDGGWLAMVVCAHSPVSDRPSKIDSEISIETKAMTLAVL